MVRPAGNPDGLPVILTMGAQSSSLPSAAAIAYLLHWALPPPASCPFFSVWLLLVTEAVSHRLPAERSWSPTSGSSIKVFAVDLAAGISPRAQLKLHLPPPPQPPPPPPPPPPPGIPSWRSCPLVHSIVVPQLPTSPVVRVSRPGVPTEPGRRRSSFSICPIYLMAAARSITTKVSPLALLKFPQNARTSTCLISASLLSSTAA